MKELRIQFRGDPWHILFAFDPNRAAILLVGGNKRGDNAGTRRTSQWPKSGSGVTLNIWKSE